MSKQGRDQGVWWLYILQQSVVQSGLLLHGVERSRAIGEGEGFLSPQIS